MDWSGACRVPLCQGRETSMNEVTENVLFCWVWLASCSLYGRILIKRVRYGNKCTLGEEQWGFRQGRECMDNVFPVKQVCDKYLTIRKDVFEALMDFKTAYDTIDRHGMLWMLIVYRVWGKSLKAVQSFYVYRCFHVSGYDRCEWMVSGQCWIATW